MLGEGPTEVARNQDEKAGYNAYIIRQWLQPQIIDFETGIDSIVEITSAQAKTIVIISLN